MAGTKLTGLTAVTSWTSDDIFYIVDAPGGTPLSRKITGANLFAAIPTATKVNVSSAAAFIVEDNGTKDNVLVVDTSNGRVLLSDDANTKNLGEITINQGANDDEAFSLKSSDVAHGVTGISETDTYYSIGKGGATSGAVLQQGFSTGGYAFLMRGVVTSVVTAKATNSGAPVILEGVLKSGTGGATITADGNLVAIKSWTVNVMLIDRESTIHHLPGSDIDVALTTVQVTGTPTLSWDESEDMFALTHGINLSAIGGDVLELPADATDPTGGGGAASGRVPVKIGGVTKYVAYYDAP